MVNSLVFLYFGLTSGTNLLQNNYRPLPLAKSNMSKMYTLNKSSAAILSMVPPDPLLNNARAIR